jgi:hypothetical protein
MKKFLSAIALSLFGAIIFGATGGSANATPFPGPDAYGYSGTNIALNFRDISATGTNAGYGCDDCVFGAIPLGFTFNYYGTSYNEVYVGTNGFLAFAPLGSGCCSGAPLPSADSINNEVAGWWTDLVSNPRYQTVGAPGSQQFILEYLNAPYYNSGTPNTFEIILHEGSNDIELQYLNTGVNSHVRSAGIENADGTIGLQIVNDNTTTLNAQGFCFSTGGTNCSAAPITPVPEPLTLTVFGAGLAGMAVMRRRRKAQAS